MYLTVKIRQHFQTKKCETKNFGIAQLLFLHIFSERSVTQSKVRKRFLAVVEAERNKRADPVTHWPQAAAQKQDGEPVTRAPSPVGKRLEGGQGQGCCAGGAATLLPAFAARAHLVKLLPSSAPGSTVQG